MTDKIVRFPVVQGGKDCDEARGRPMPPSVQVEVRGVKFPFVPVVPSR